MPLIQTPKSMQGQENLVFFKDNPFNVVIKDMTKKNKTPTNYYAKMKATAEILKTMPMDKILKNAFPDLARWEWSPRSMDVLGSDLQVILAAGEVVHVDIKLASRDPFANSRPALAIETWYDLELKKPGWPFRLSSISDKVLWLFRDTEEWVLADFRELQHAVYRKIRELRRASYVGTNDSFKGGKTVKSEFMLVSVSTLERYLSLTQSRKAA